MTVVECQHASLNEPLCETPPLTRLLDHANIAYAHASNLAFLRLLILHCSQCNMANIAHSNNVATGCKQMLYPIATLLLCAILAILH